MELREILTVGFATSIVVANITAAKLAYVPVIDAAVPAGFIAFGVAFLLSDLLVEYYGEGYASRVLWATVAFLGVAYALIWIAISLPTSSFYDDTAYTTVLGSSGSVMLASIITIAASQRFDVWLFARIKDHTGEKRRWARNILSTGTSQIFDTVVFISLAFALFPAIRGGTPLWGMALVSTIVGQYLAKVVVALLDTPVFYAITELHK